MTKKHNAIRMLVTLTVVLSLSGCFYDEGISEVLPNSLVVSYAADIQPIFDSNCTSCHPFVVAAPDLTDANSYDAILLNSYVVPNDLDASLLYQKLVGKPNVMPPSGPLLQKEIDLVKVWIEQGALNN